MNALKLANLFVNGITPEIARIGLSYLSKFYSLSIDETNIDVIRTAIKNAQGIFGLHPSGILDLQLSKAITTIPRCGFSDKLKLEINRITNQWDPDLPITYFVVGYVPGLSPQEQEDTFAAAFGAWEKFSASLRVYRVDSPDNANIIIDSSSSQAEEFGSVGNVLAWAQLPQGSKYRGKLIAKFDKAENWKSTSLKAVATHEFGHLFGLEHTQVTGELMYPIYNPDVTTPQLKYDVPQFQLRYGIPTVPPIDKPDDKPNIIVTYNNKRYSLVPLP